MTPSTLVNSPRHRCLAATFGLLVGVLGSFPGSWPVTGLGAQSGPVPLPNPILFVTQVPVPADFTTIGAVFGNHQGALWSVARGGDLWIRYGDGTMKNLTSAAGYGNAGMQGTGGIAVREPSVHWSGTKALFSMVIGAPTQQYQVLTYYWQIYEVTGLAPNDTPVITRVSNQPVNFNNVSPIYGTDDRIIFTSDRPRDGQPHLHPQLDEYEEAPVVSGLWSWSARPAMCSSSSIRRRDRSRRRSTASGVSCTSGGITFNAISRRTLTS
jgi:hypothetical protein